MNPHPAPGPGRPAGVPNKVNALVRSRIEREADPVGFLISVANGNAVTMKSADGEHEVYPDFDQRMQAQRLLLNKLMPDAKSAPVHVDLPEIHTSEDVLKATGAVVAAVARGDLLPDAGEAMVAILETKRRAIETVALEKRLATLEKQRDGR